MQLVGWMSVQDWSQWVVLGRTTLNQDYLIICIYLFKPKSLSFKAYVIFICVYVHLCMYICVDMYMSIQVHVI